MHETTFLAEPQPAWSQGKILCQLCLGGGFGHCPFQIGSAAVCSRDLSPWQCHCTGVLGSRGSYGTRSFEVWKLQASAGFPRSKVAARIRRRSNSLGGLPLPGGSCAGERGEDLRYGEMGPLPLCLVKRLQGPAL